MKTKHIAIGFVLGLLIVLCIPAAITTTAEGRKSPPDIEMQTIAEVLEILNAIEENQAEAGEPEKTPPEDHIKDRGTNMPCLSSEEIVISGSQILSETAWDSR